MAQPMDPLRAFAELGRIKFSETGLDGVAERIVETGRDTLPGADDVSITIAGGRHIRTAASDGALARLLDEAQYELRSGPALHAAESATTVHVADTSIDTRWNDWAVRASSLGVRAALSVGMLIRHDLRGSVNVYSRTAGLPDADAVRLARTFADFASVALANAYHYDATATLADQLRSAMEHRAVIEQAKGIIMGDRRCGEQEAFAILSKLSQDSNRKLRDIATALVTRATGSARPSAEQHSASP
jgi:GAF domain-containing protein